MMNLLISFLGTAVGDAERVLSQQRQYRELFDESARRRRKLIRFREAIENRLYENGEDENV